jgi:hypothetical protein
VTTVLAGLTVVLATPMKFKVNGEESTGVFNSVVGVTPQDPQILQDATKYHK